MVAAAVQATVGVQKRIGQKVVASGLNLRESRWFSSCTTGSMPHPPTPLSAARSFLDRETCGEGGES
jgi:hypothetical protein